MFPHLTSSSKSLEQGEKLQSAEKMSKENHGGGNKGKESWGWIVPS